MGKVGFELTTTCVVIERQKKPTYNFAAAGLEIGDAWEPAKWAKFTALTARFDYGNSSAIPTAALLEDRRRR